MTEISYLNNFSHAVARTSESYHDLQMLEEIRKLYRR